MISNRCLPHCGHVKEYFTITGDSVSYPRKLGKVIKKSHCYRLIVELGLELCQVFFLFECLSWTMKKDPSRKMGRSYHNCFHCSLYPPSGNKIN